MFYRHSLSFCAGLLGLFVVNQATAGISLSSTRLVFDGQHKEAGITVRNSGADVLVQSWIDTDASESASVPFAVTPPLVRVSGDEQQILRVIYEGAGMPTDRESVVWLNVQEIPQSAKSANTLQLAVRQRIKVFFRPAGLKNNAYLAPGELTWRLAERAGRKLFMTGEITTRASFVADKAAGLIAPDDATFMLQNLFIKLNEIGYYFGEKVALVRDPTRGRCHIQILTTISGSRLTLLQTQ